MNREELHTNRSGTHAVQAAAVCAWGNLYDKTRPSYDSYLGHFEYQLSELTALTN